MKAYVLSIAGTAIFAAIISYLCVNKRQRKVVDGVCKVCILLAIISPVLAYYQGQNEDISENLGVVALNDEYIRNELSATIQNGVCREYGVTSVVSVNTDETGKVTSIHIKILDYGINTENERIYILTEIEKGVKAQFNGAVVEVK